jgi:hypothetical protein
VAGVSGHDCKLPMCTPTTAVARYQPVLSDVERMTLLGFLAAYRGYTRDAYALDLRQFTAPKSARSPGRTHRLPATTPWAGVPCWLVRVLKSTRPTWTYRAS